MLVLLLWFCVVCFSKNIFPRKASTFFWTRNVTTFLLENSRGSVSLCALYQGRILQYISNTFNVSTPCALSRTSVNTLLKAHEVSLEVHRSLEPKGTSARFHGFGKCSALEPRAEVRDTITLTLGSTSFDATSYQRSSDLIYE